MRTQTSGKRLLQAIKEVLLTTLTRKSMWWEKKPFFKTATDITLYRTTRTIPTHILTSAWNIGNLTRLNAQIFQPHWASGKSTIIPCHFIPLSRGTICTSFTLVVFSLIDICGLSWTICRETHPPKTKKPLSNPDSNRSWKGALCCSITKLYLWLNLKIER